MTREVAGESSRIVDRLEGDMAGTRDGVVRGHAKVEARKAE